MIVDVFVQCCHKKMSLFNDTFLFSVPSALEVHRDYALYKSTYYIALSYCVWQSFVSAYR